MVEWVENSFVVLKSLNVFPECFVFFFKCICFPESLNVFLKYFVFFLKYVCFKITKMFFRKVLCFCLIVFLPESKMFFWKVLYFSLVVFRKVFNILVLIHVYFKFWFLLFKTKAHKNIYYKLPKCCCCCCNLHKLTSRWQINCPPTFIYCSPNVNCCPQQKHVKQFKW